MTSPRGHCELATPLSLPMPTGPNDETIVPATASPGSAGFFAASPPPAEPVDPVLDAQQAIGGRYRLSG